VSEEMYEDGYTTIDNIDISDVVIQAMQAKHSDKTGLTWEVMDCTALNHPDGIYDVVFDKGTVDSLLCGEGSTAKVATVCAEVSRVLKDDGTFFMVSYGIPDNRLSYLENADYNWTVKVHAIPKPTVTATAMMESKDATSVHYIYVCSKGDDSGK
jgi:ubiquinone/menaquinone biosynthesis C-methylase UbiE|tara:strand:- start:1039 stop:1503 length:465 start_codon:yes stop_codon:yes gene_type:complete